MLYIPEICRMDKISGFISKDKSANMVAKGGDRTVVRCSVVGDSMVGKTATVQAFTDSDAKDYSPTIFENYAGTLSNEGEEFMVSIFDLSGQHEHEDLRAFTYTDSQAFVLCYSAIDQNSFQSVKDFWVPEIRKHARKKKPIVLVATQCNLRDTTSYDSDVPVSTQDGESLAKEIEVACFLEISDVSKENSDKVFQQVVIQTQKQKKRRSRSTKILQKVLGRS